MRMKKIIVTSIGVGIGLIGGKLLLDKVINNKDEKKSKEYYLKMLNQEYEKELKKYNKYPSLIEDMITCLKKEDNHKRSLFNKIIEKTLALNPKELLDYSSITDIDEEVEGLVLKYKELHDKSLKMNSSILALFISRNVEMLKLQLNKLDSDEYISKKPQKQKHTFSRVIVKFEDIK